jgi:tetratricopeptide (TPR) repeat protein
MWRKERLYINLSKLFMITKCLFEAGETSTAKQGYESLLAHSQVKNMGDIYWVTLLDMGRIHALEGNREKALELFETAAEIIEKQRSTINTEASKIGFVGDKQKVYYHIVKNLFEEGRYEKAFEFIERSKARALVDLLASKSNFASSRVDEVDIDALLKEVNDAERESIKIAHVSARSSLERNARAIAIKKISEASPELTSLITVESTDATSLQALIPLGETVVEYYSYGDNWYAVIATRNSVEGVVLDCTGITRDVADFRKALLKSALDIRGIEIKAGKPTLVETSGVAHLDLKCRRMCQKIFDPLEDKITTRNVTIVPHGALHYLPFATLLSEGGYLIERYNIRVMPSVSVLKFLARQKNRKIGDLFIMGNPNLGDPKYDLPFAQDEALALKNMMADSKVLLRGQATETAFKKYGNQFTRIHLACHGTFNADDALHSGLLLSADGENDGRITVSELYDMRLNANLVTLSACETALGKVANGDDVVGFTRGFLYSGASSVVSSLWQVDDKATSILMQYFYNSLKDIDKRQALRTAQLKVKDTYNSHPYFWAAFQITGSVQ